MPDETHIDRRKFGGSLAAGTVATLLASPFNSIADDKPPVERKEEAKTNEDSEPPALPSEEVLLLACLMQRYPSNHFDEAARQGIYLDLRGDLARGRVLSEFPLKNSDEPCFAFRADRGPQ